MAQAILIIALISFQMGKFKNQLFSGVLWTAFQTIVNRGFKFIIKLILARVLFPEDYGIIGMAAVFTSVVSVFSELGMGAALIQKKKESLTNTHYHTAFWTGLVWGLLIYLVIIFGIGPLASWFYNEPILERVIPFLSLGVLVSPISLVHYAKLTRNLEFKKIAVISNIGNITAGILALIVAFQGGGVWSLVVNNVASSVIILPLFFYSTKWIPLRRFSRKAFKDIFGFGVYTMGTTVLIKVATQLDYLIVGKLLGAKILGIYTLAFLLTSTVKAQILQIASNVLYPLFSEMQDDLSGLKSKYLKVQRMNSFVIIPLMFFVISFADQLIALGFGDKWEGASILLKILGAGVIFNMLTVSSGILIRASGKPRLELRITTLTTLFIYGLLLEMLTGRHSGAGTGYGRDTSGWRNLPMSRG